MAEKLERERHTFDSSMVNKAWWDPAKELLEVEFNDGTRWRYEHVTKSIWRGFKSSGSPGRYVHGVLDQLPNHRK